MAQFSVGPNSSSSGANNTSVGTVDWGGLTQTEVSDNLYAIRNAVGLNEITHYLAITDFGFSIPDSAVIRGIELQIERRKNSGTGNVQDYSIRLIRNGVIAGEDKASASNWPTSDTTAFYGTDDDLWDLTFTSSDINSSNFGIAISAIGGIGGTTLYGIDYVGLTIHYDLQGDMGDDF